MTVRELIVELEQAGLDRQVVCYDADDSQWYPIEVPLTLWSCLLCTRDQSRVLRRDPCPLGAGDRTRGEAGGLMPTVKQTERDRAEWEKLRRQVRTGDRATAADKPDMKAQIMAYLEAKVDRQLKRLRDGQALAIVFRLEVMNSDFSFRGESSARNAPEYAQWRDEVYRRDRYACVDCGSDDNLQAHHVQEWARYPERRFDVDNGQTLCLACHEKRHPHLRVLRGSRTRKKAGRL